MAKTKRKSPQLTWSADDELTTPQADLFLGCQPYSGAYDAQGIVTEHGVFATACSTESPRSDDGSSAYSPVTLSQTLETEQDWLARHPGSTSRDWWTYLARYFLSKAACAGILRRAAARGRTLPIELEAALRAVAGEKEA